MGLIDEKLKEVISNYNPIEVSSVFSALLLNPKYQPHTLTLETAIHTCLTFCKGDKEASSELIQQIYDDIHAGISAYEDPIENIFISKLWFNDKSYKVLEGLWEGGVHSTQVTLQVVELLPNEDIFIELKEKVELILKVSDLIIEQNYPECDKLGSREFLPSLDKVDLQDIDELLNKVKTTNKNFSSLPSIDKKTFYLLSDEELGNSILEQAPFYHEDNKIILLLPTAITVCLRRTILKFFISYEKKDLFLKYYGDILSKQFYETKIFGNLYRLPVKFYTKEGISTFKFAENIVEFDTNYFFHFVFVLDTLENIEGNWFAGFIPDEQYRASDFIDSRIEKIKQNTLNKNSNSRGCSIIVPCGLGRGFMLAGKTASDNNWFFESISDHDLVTISDDLDCTPNLIWRIIEAEYKLKKFGTEIVNLNGLLNLYAYVKDNNYSIFINEEINEESSGSQVSTIILESNYNAYIREKVALDKNTIEVKDIYNKTRIVKRAFSDSLFSTNVKQNLYMPDVRVNKNIFEVVYTDNNYTIWITQNIDHSLDFVLQYKLFDALITWFNKTMITLNKHSIKISEDLHLWNIQYTLIKDISMLVKDITKEQILNSYDNSYNNYILNTTFNIDILKGFMFEENYAEQAMVLSFLNFLKLDQQNIDILLKEIIVSEDARLMHFFRAHKYREHFDIAEEKPIVVHQIDDQIIKLNLGWSCRTKEEGNTIEGKEECTLYLRNLMDVVWRRIQSKLKQIEREDLVLKLLKNYEYSDKEKDIWERTFKSNLALQEDKDDLYEVALNKISELTASSLSSRLLIEMAICECSVNCGEDVGELDLQELMSLALYMHIFGGLSESIKYESVPPKIIISSFGDILYDHSFNDLVLQKYHYAFNQKILDSKTLEYGKHFKDLKYTKKVNHLFKKGFMEAYVDEFGYTVDDARLFVDFLEDYGLKINKLVFNITHNDLIELFEPEYKEVFIKILDSYILHTRKDWTSIPKPYKRTDWQPWKFRRRYSLIMKPIVEIDSFEGLLMLSPELIRTAHANLLLNIYEGYLEAEQFQSKSMRAWIGNCVKERGLAFNSSVKEKFIELGFEAVEEIKLTEILNKKMIDFGDIDVLAWSKEKNIVYAVECKSLETAKTQSEVSRQLYEFKGQINDKNIKDRLYKHYLRYEELKKDIEGIKKFLKFDHEFELKALVVFSNLVPMNFDINRNFMDIIDFVSFDDLR